MRDEAGTGQRQDLLAQEVKVELDESQLMLQLIIADPATAVVIVGVNACGDA